MHVQQLAQLVVESLDAPMGINHHDPLADAGQHALYQMVLLNQFGLQAGEGEAIDVLQRAPGGHIKHHGRIPRKTAQTTLTA